MARQRRQGPLFRRRHGYGGQAEQSDAWFGWHGRPAHVFNPTGETPVPLRHRPPASLDRRDPAAGRGLAALGANEL
ncbi:MAG TPA: hypothetical protein PKY38_15060, partial [Opitutaceae bacterium]|nr:hypothetical protein [Opitutaceae bacterium]